MNQRQPSNRGFRGGFDDARSDAGSERGGSRRPGFFENDGKVRDFGNWERKGPLSPVPTTGPPVRDGGRLREAGPTSERRRSPAWGEGRSDAGSRPPRPAPERAPTAAEQDNQWRARMRPDPSPAPTPEASAPTSPAAKEAPKERPRLNLTKRTVSTAETDAPTASGSDSKASPFGAARPIDTATREREIEEKRQLAIRQKQEAEQKAKEEKATQEAAARAARAERADRGQTQEDEKATSPTSRAPPTGPRRPSRQQNGTKPQQPKENGEAPQKERPSFSILSREGGEEDAAAQESREGAEDAPDAPANGTIVGDKEVKPQEITQEVGANQTAEPTAEAMQDDGWSTVSTKPRGGRRGGQRAMAS
jgi:translation initiation factor 4B